MLTSLLQALFSGLAVGSAYALIALGFSITFATTRTLNFAQGDFVSAGAFIGVAVLFAALGIPASSTTFSGAQPASSAQLLALVAAVLGMGAIGWLLYVLGVRPFAGRPGMAWVMSTLGFGVILQSIGMAIWGPKSVVVPGPFGSDVIRVAGVGMLPQEVLTLVVATAVMLAFDHVMRRTMIGKAMRAVAYKPEVAGLMGINVTGMMVGAFVLSSALAGLSGFLLAPIIQLSLFMSVAVGLKGFSAAIVGGLDNPRGCVFGGFALGVLESFINLWSAQWREVAIFALVIVVLAVRPNGLFGTRVMDKV
ncbi:branched-chain amino acid ABC transporter permease [Rhodoferax sediminis]|uniref:Branched-chain amino acid ABC transporter permease n=1 Tax=Rhodoferax sediminis TaxID=2509614 RepID=A0A515DE34_9BURK|nr:branched-chain amino acid ABC transporter permease [Rhodoferax sediminis]QDL38630.1 branched-chain amino acid ABC transporter permease [Rhodoferax sediminis]